MTRLVLLFAVAASLCACSAEPLAKHEAGAAYYTAANKHFQAEFQEHAALGIKLSGSDRTTASRHMRLSNLCVTASKLALAIASVSGDLTPEDHEEIQSYFDDVAEGVRDKEWDIRNPFFMHLRDAFTFGSEAPWRAMQEDLIAIQDIAKARFAPPPETEPGADEDSDEDRDENDEEWE